MMRKREVKTPPEAERPRRLHGMRLALALAAGLALALALRLGLARAFQALFRAWNLSAATLGRAPGWARALYAWHGSLITLAVDAAVIGLSVALARRWALPWPEGRASRAAAAAAALTGAGAALLSAALFLATDSLRLEWPLAQPRLSPGLAALALLSLLTAVAEEWFGKRVVYALAHAAWGPVPAAIAATAVFFLANGGCAGNLWCALNVLLMGLLCCRVFRLRGFMAAAALRWGWSFTAVFLLGQGGGGRAVYRLYGVSEVWLTGGDAGFVYGAWLALLLAAALLAPAVPGMRARLKRGRAR